MVYLPEDKKSFTTRLAVSTEYRRVTNRRTDRRTSCHSIVYAMRMHRAVKMTGIQLAWRAHRNKQKIVVNNQVDDKVTASNLIVCESACMDCLSNVKQYSYWLLGAPAPVYGDTP